MTKHYTPLELANAINAMLALLYESCGSSRIEALLEEHDCIAEVDQFGPTGPCGMGLGRYGGHAVE